MNKKFELYKTLGLFGLLFLPISLFFRLGFIDIHVYDTYIVTSKAQVLVIFSTIFLLSYFVHSHSRVKTLTKKIRLIHIVITLIGGLILLLGFYIASQAYRPGFDDWTFFEVNNSILTLLIPVYLVTQFCYLVYFLFKILKSKN